ncbi:hypothetical protein GDO78_018426 [Eleutherodactylus coqui]|uniref:Guanylate kinase-like domain-containing protein n=1 Tax=Eleutherodactylus coqui TaxID=57060 RepID=A0A8J6EPP9_ELECQ|nr:hypothetical protein GDO78_018426 [Eleutherodactylus coqui]
MTAKPHFYGKEGGYLMLGGLPNLSDPICCMSLPDSKMAVQAVQARNQVCILDIDMQGVRNIKKTDLNPIYISIHPPSVEILVKRLRDRNTESEESLQKRLQAAIDDMEISKEPGLFDEIIINDDLEEAYSRLTDVLKEEIAAAQTSKDS